MAQESQIIASLRAMSSIEPMPFAAMHGLVKDFDSELLRDVMQEIICEKYGTPFYKMVSFSEFLYSDQFNIFLSLGSEFKTKMLSWMVNMANHHKETLTTERPTLIFNDINIDMGCAFRNFDGERGEITVRFSFFLKTDDEEEYLQCDLKVDDEDLYAQFHCEVELSAVEGRQDFLNEHLEKHLRYIHDGTIFTEDFQNWGVAGNSGHELEISPSTRKIDDIVSNVDAKAIFKRWISEEYHWSLETP